MLMLKTARALAEKGMAVFPCLPRDKRPATPHGLKDATTDPIEIENWWHQNPSCNIAIATGIDVRATGGYVIAPPSIHPSGKRYCWSVDSAATFAAAPEWLLSIIAEPENGTAAPASEWRELVCNGVAEGQRNSSAASLAGYLLRRFIDPIVVLELVQSWNALRCSPPLPPDEIIAIVNSICGRELARRQA